MAKSTAAPAQLVRLCPETRLEVVAVLRQAGWSYREIQAGLGVSARTMERYRRRLILQRRWRAAAVRVIEA